MNTKTIRVLVVDDSALIREMICDAIKATPGFEVAGTAADGRQAIEMIGTLTPDVVTLDVQMPRMDGLQTLDEILKIRPTPVIMVSALTQLGANTTLEALDRGALDYIAKPEGRAAAETVFRDELPRKIRAMAGVDVQRMIAIRKRRAERAGELRTQAATKAAAPQPVAPAPEFANKCIAIGISTGGPPALAGLFEQLRPPLPPIVVVQHMPPQFTKAFAWRLNSLSQLEIKEAATGDLLRPNHVYIAPGGTHLSVTRHGKTDVACQVKDGEPVSGHKPSVDVMMRSVAELYGNRVLGVIMTGMGRDGSDGCGLIRAAGGYVIGQDEESSDVYGMNKVAFVSGHVDRQFGLDEAATIITQQVRRLWSRATVLR